MPVAHCNMILRTHAEVMEWHSSMDGPRAGFWVFCSCPVCNFLSRLTRHKWRELILMFLSVTCDLLTADLKVAYSARFSWVCWVIVAMYQIWSNFNSVYCWNIWRDATGLSHLIVMMSLLIFTLAKAWPHLHVLKIMSCGWLVDWCSKNQTLWK
jgi:hypothetical protein